MVEFSIVQTTCECFYTVMRPPNDDLVSDS